MRFFATIFTLVSLTLASPSHHSIKSRQYHPTRSLKDTCASVGDLIISQTNYGSMDSCLCLTNVWQFITVNPAAKAAVAKLGENAVKNAIKQDIRAAQDKYACQYPKHATSAFAFTGLCETACKWQCQDGFTARYAPVAPTKRSIELPTRTVQEASEPISCDCEAPKVIYNGKCVTMAAYPSGSPHPSPVPSGRYRS